MPDEYPDYEYLGQFGPDHHDGFYQVALILHRPCGAVIVDRDAHAAWHRALIRDVVKVLREEGKREARRLGVQWP